MNRYKITVAYDGTRYRGWQRQPDGESIQSMLENALAPLADPAACTVYGAGRTDAGVHARGAVAHFDLEREIAPVNLRRALNGALPPDIQIVSAEPAARDFDARRHAIGKEYRYFVTSGEIVFPDRCRYSAHVRKTLDTAAMKKAAAYFPGTHDFAAFTANPNREIESTVRTIFSVEIAGELPEIQIRVKGDGFLYKMVRSISGFLISVGEGKEKPEAVVEVMNSRVRTSRVETAPARGLFLWQVFY